MRLTFALLWVCTMLGIALCAGCGPAGAEFDRVPPPISFAHVRETARWCPSFDSRWWDTIDDSYAQYEVELEELMLREWSQYAKLATQEVGQSRQGDVGDARSLLARMRNIEEKSLGMEGAFADRCSALLPTECKPFLELLRARRRFERAGSTWTTPDEVLPGVFELLALDGGPIRSEALMLAATGAYARGAEVLERERRRRFAAYIEFIESNAVSLVSQAQVKETFGADSPEAKQAAEQFGALRNTMEHAYRATDEAVRKALQSEVLAMREFIEDPERRANFEERMLQVFVLGGIAAPDARGRIALWKALAEQAATAQERAQRLRQLETFEAHCNMEWEAIKAALRVGDPSQDAAIRARAKQLISYFETHAPPLTGVDGDNFDRLARLIASRKITAAEAAAALFEQGVPMQVEQVAVEPDALIKGRNEGMRLFAGWPLHPNLTESVTVALSLDATQSVRVEEFRREEAKRLATQTEPKLSKIEKVGNDLQGSSTASVDARVRHVMQSVRAQLQSTHALDLEANARFFSRVAQEFGVSAEDARWRVPRLRATLACIVGETLNMREAENIGGVTAAADYDLLQLPRAAGLTDTESEAFFDLVIGHESELLEAARATHERMLMNVSRLFRVIALQGQSAEYWETLEAGEHAADLRLAILSEARRVLGPEAGDRLESAFRRAVTPGLEAPRATVIEALRDCAENPATEPRLAATAAVTIAEADARSARALREALRWRAHTVLANAPTNQEDWAQLSRSAPLGALLRTRAMDADERALAAIAAALEGSELPGWLAQGLEYFEPREVRVFVRPAS